MKTHSARRLWSVAAFLCCSVTAPALAQAATVSARVVETRLRQGALPHHIYAYGVVAADPAVEQAIMAPVAASVRAIEIRLGQSVARGAPLIALAPSPNARASYAQAQSALSAAVAGEARIKALVHQFLATRQDLANAQKAVADARANLSALNAVGAGAPRILRAPFAATVTALSTRVGSLVQEGTPLLTIAPPSALVLRVGVTPADAAQLQLGAAASLTPVSGGVAATLHGRVVMRGAVVDPTTGLVPIEISLPANQLFPGETVRAAITARSVSGIIVPHAALLLDTRGRPYVVQAPHGRAKLIPVVVLNSDNGEDVIAGPLDLSAPLVLAGNYQLKPGMRVRLADPPAGAGVH
jgi:RND family efflux transporter MFP subunit